MPGLTWNSRRGCYGTDAYHEYVGLIDKGYSPEHQIKDVLGEDRLDGLISKGLLSPAVTDSQGEPWYDRAEAIQHTSYQNPALGHGCCRCCGHCPPEALVATSQHRGKLLVNKGMSMRYDDDSDETPGIYQEGWPDDDVVDDVEYVRPEPYYDRQLSPRLEAEVKSLRRHWKTWLEEMTPKPLSKTAESALRQLRRQWEAKFPTLPLSILKGDKERVFRRSANW